MLPGVPDDPVLALLPTLGVVGTGLMTMPCAARGVGDWVATLWLAKAWDKAEASMTSLLLFVAACAPMVEMARAMALAGMNRCAVFMVWNEMAWSHRQRKTRSSMKGVDSIHDYGNSPLFFCHLNVTLWKIPPALHDRSAASAELGMGMCSARRHRPLPDASWPSALAMSATGASGNDFLDDQPTPLHQLQMQGFGVVELEAA
jgi:hypothetical protein